MCTATRPGDDWREAGVTGERVAKIEGAMRATRDCGAFPSIPRQSKSKAKTAPIDPADGDTSFESEELDQIEAAQLDPRAFAPLYETYADLVWRYAMSRLGNADRAAEVTSITFARALAALPRFRPRPANSGSPFRAWLMTIARNAVIDEVRRERHAPSLDDPAVQPWLIDRGRTPEDLAIAGDEQRRVERALARLPVTQRRIVELRLIGMRSAKIAEILEMSQSAIDTAHFRAYARLREWLAEPDDGGPS